MSNRTIIQYEIEDIGIDNASYFVGRGTTFTKWDEVAVGIGGNAYEALEDALEILATGGFNVGCVKNEFNPHDDFSVDLGWSHAVSCPLSDDFDPAEYYDDPENFDPDQAECDCDYTGESENYYYVAVWLREADGFEPRKGDDLSIRGKNKEVTGHTFVDQVLNIFMKDNKPCWCVVDHIGRHFFAHDPYVMDDGELSWLADGYDRSHYLKVAEHMGIKV